MCESIDALRKKLYEIWSDGVKAAHSLIAMDIEAGSYAWLPRLLARPSTIHVSGVELEDAQLLWLLKRLFMAFFVYKKLQFA